MKSVRMEEDDLEDTVSAGDNRKVVVEDLIFIDDLEIIIYSTVSPKTSVVFITSLKKSHKPDCKSDSDLHTIELANIGAVDMNTIQEKQAENLVKKEKK